MIEKAKVPKTNENTAKCVCPRCPTYNTCMNSNEENLFCSKGRSKCDIDKKGCNCPTCPIWKEYGLDNFYYCEIGIAR